MHCAYQIMESNHFQIRVSFYAGDFYWIFFSVLLNFGIETFFGIQYYWKFGIENFQYSIVLNGITDIFGIPEIPKMY
jgi:hypothetical protein